MLLVDPDSAPEAELHLRTFSVFYVFVSVLPVCASWNSALPVLRSILSLPLASSLLSAVSLVSFHLPSVPYIYMIVSLRNFVNIFLSLYGTFLLTFYIQRGIV